MSETSLRLLFEGTRFVAIDKPPGLPVIPGRGQGGEAGRHARAWLEEQLGRRVLVVHRLDRDTSGVLLFALDEAAHRALSMAFEAGAVRKRYLALVEGVCGFRERVVDQGLVAARRGRMRVAREGDALAKPARSVFRCLGSSPLGPGSWLEAEPQTGRTHQLRVHLASIGHPLLVDHQYGRKDRWELGGAALDRTPLHAASVSLPPDLALALDLGVPRIDAPLPADMAQAVEALFGGQRPG